MIWSESEVKSILNIEKYSMWKEILVEIIFSGESMYSYWDSFRIGYYLRNIFYWIFSIEHIRLKNKYWILSNGQTYFFCGKYLHVQNQRTGNSFRVNTKVKLKLSNKSFELFIVKIFTEVLKLEEKNLKGKSREYYV